MRLTILINSAALSWNATCLPLSQEANALHESASPIGCEPLISVVKGDSTSGVMEEVLAQCLLSFYRTAYRFLGNSAGVEDVVQDALLSAY